MENKTIIIAQCGLGKLLAEQIVANEAFEPEPILYRLNDPSLRKEFKPNNRGERRKKKK